VTARFLIAVLLGFLAMFVINAAAALVIDPLFGAAYPELTGGGPRLDFAPLVGGYVLIALVMASLYVGRKHRPRWLQAGLSTGLPVAMAAFLGVHMVQAGYTHTDNVAWILSGLLDVPGPIVGALVIAFILDGATPSDAHAALP
jgi:hypothetical protein